MWFRKKIDAEKIKKSNTKKLRLMGIKLIEHLPMLDKPEFRDSEKVARRMMVLLALFQLYLNAPNDIIEKWLDENGLLTELTEEEQMYLKTNYSNLPEQSQIDIYWYIESIWAFAWIGGLHNKLTFNTNVEDSLITLIPNIHENESAIKFIADFEIRNQFEIFEMLDNFFRAHWFARHNNLRGKKSKKADLDIIMERRKALQYTVYKEYEWDNISLDT